MKRTRAQQPKVEEPQDPATATGAANPKPQRRAKQPRQPKAAAGGGGAKTKSGAVGPRAAAAAGTAAAKASAAAAGGGGNAGSAASSSPGGPETKAPTVPDVCFVGGGKEEEGDVGDARAVDWDLDDAAGLNAAAAWWTWGVDEEKLLGWFPFVEEDFRCGGGGRAGDAEVAASFDHDIWSIW